MKVEGKKGRLDQEIENWLSGLTCTEASKATYIRTLRAWNNWLIMHKHYNAMGATRFDTAEYRKYLIDTKKSPHTICSYLSTLRMFYHYLYLHGSRTDVAADLRGVKRNKYFNKRPLTDDQVCDLLGSIDLSTATGRRDRLIIMLMIRAGLRCCEVSRLDVGDITSVSGTASLRLQRKGHLDKDTLIPIADDLADALGDYLSTRKAKRGEPLILSHNKALCGEIRRIAVQDIERSVKRRMRDAGISGEGLSTHSLRHTFGCMLVAAGVPIDQVQALMGHNSIDATMIYVKMAADRKLFETNPANMVKINYRR